MDDQLYFDTSALLPYYRQEASSDRIQDLLSRQRRPVTISRLTLVEFASALARWVRMGELGDSHANRLESVFREDIAEGRFVVREVESRHFERAAQWLQTRKTGLRTLDALQLACSETGGGAMVTLDAELRAAGIYLGLNVYDFGVS